MKKIRVAAILMALVLGGMASCTKDNSGTSAASTTSITNTGGGGGNGGGAPNGNTRVILESGTWKISGSTNGYTFNFSDDGSVRVNDGGTMYGGTWATTAERQDVLHMEFPEGPSTLSALNGDWQVMSISTALVQLKGLTGQGSFSFEKL